MIAPIELIQRLAIIVIVVSEVVLGLFIRSLVLYLAGLALFADEGLLDLLAGVLARGTGGVLGLLVGGIDGLLLLLLLG